MNEQQKSLSPQGHGVLLASTVCWTGGHWLVILPVCFAVD